MPIRKSVYIACNVTSCTYTLNPHKTCNRFSFCMRLQRDWSSHKAHTVFDRFRCEQKTRISSAWSRPSSFARFRVFRTFARLEPNVSDFRSSYARLLRAGPLPPYPYDIIAPWKRSSELEFTLSFPRFPDTLSLFVCRAEIEQLIPK